MIRFIIMILAIFGILTTTNAQWTIDNSNVIGGNGNESFNDIIETTDGYIAVGFTTTSNNGDIDNFNNGLSDYWVVKLDLLGNLVWQKNFGGIGNDIAHSIAQTSDGNFWIFGEIDSIGTQIDNFYGKKDAWGIKINENGELLNNVTFGGSEDDIIKDIAINENGDMYLVGTTTSTNGIIETDWEAENAWLVITNEVGELQLSETFGGNKKDGFNTIAYAEQNQQFYIGGYTNSEDGDISTTPQLTDTWLVAIDSGAYHIAWQQIWGGSSAEIIVDISILQNGNIAFTGETSSTDLANFSGLFDILTGVCTPNGNLLWTKVYGGTAGDSPLQIVENQSNNLALIAYSNSLGGNIGFGYQAFNIWLAELDVANGNLLKSQVLGGNRWDFGSTITPLENGYFITGNTDSYDGDVVDGSGKKRNNKKPPKDGNHDIWIAKLSDIPINNNELITENKISVFPNPSSQYIQIEGIFDELKLYDLQGKLLLKSSANTIDIQYLLAGMYLIECYRNGQKNKAVRWQKL